MSANERLGNGSLWSGPDVGHVHAGDAGMRARQLAGADGRGPGLAGSDRRTTGRSGRKLAAFDRRHVFDWRV